MSEQFAELLVPLPAYLGGHMLLSLAALAVGLAISLPLGILASRRPRLAEITLGVAGVIQTVPSLALLALMVPLLGRIGFLPAFIALTLYSILPILANTIVGIRGVDPTLIEAARGLGMSDGQMLLKVQLPLAAAVIIGGIRTGTVLVVGTATLAAPVGDDTLGSYIFQGLDTSNELAVVFGCVLAALLAVLLDQLVRLLELAAQRRSRRLALLGGAGLLVVLIGGLWQPLQKLFTSPATHVVVGSVQFTEQHILSEVLKERLQAAGCTVDQRKGLGETIQFDSLRQGAIDCGVNYTGNVWATRMKRKDPADRRTIYDESIRYLESQGVVCLGSLGFENAYAFAMEPKRARALGIRSLADLARHAPRLKLAADLQFFARVDWFSVRDAYGLHFRELKSMNPTLMYLAIAGGEVDVICAYTSDGRIKANDLLILDDPKQAFPPYDALLLLSPQAAARPDLVAALKPLVGSINLDLMRRINGRVDIEQWSVRRAATELMQEIAK